MKTNVGELVRARTAETENDRVKSENFNIDGYDDQSEKLFEDIDSLVALLKLLVQRKK